MHIYWGHDLPDGICYRSHHQEKTQEPRKLPQYYAEDTHPAVIDKATFDYVQAEMARWRELNCGVSYMRNNRTDRGGLEFLNCGSKKKKEIGSGCPMGVQSQGSAGTPIIRTAGYRSAGRQNRNL